MAFFLFRFDFTREMINCIAILIDLELDTNGKIRLNLILFHSVPQNGERRQKWIDAITKHQSYDFTSLSFALCELHFHSEDIHHNWKKNKLNTNAIPLFFPLYVN